MGNTRNGNAPFSNAMFRVKQKVKEKWEFRKNKSKKCKYNTEKNTTSRKIGGNPPQLLVNSKPLNLIPNYLRPQLVSCEKLRETLMHNSKKNVCNG